MQFDIHKNLYFLRICGNFNISKNAFLLLSEERCEQRSCVVCPQADVICTCGALYVAKPRWLAIGYGRLDALSPHRLIALLPHFQRAFELGEEADIQIAILVHIRRQSVHIQYPVSLRRYRHVGVYVSIVRC